MTDDAAGVFAGVLAGVLNVSDEETLGIVCTLLTGHADPVCGFPGQGDTGSAGVCILSRQHAQQTTYKEMYKHKTLAYLHD